MRSVTNSYYRTQPPGPYLAGLGSDDGAVDVARFNTQDDPITFAPLGHRLTSTPTYSAVSALEQASP